ncbi:MAG: chemotaxis protein CheR, partial [Desulfobacterales bacterium]|nr:chemotaxis protein CheR [Desulfobacterales bacterium]
MKLKKIKTLTNHQKEKLFIVGIGASAGGLEAFESFFRHMPPKTGIAFVLITHLDPQKISILPDLIKKFTQMNVFVIEEGVKVQPNTVYVIPPNKNCAIYKGTLQIFDITKPDEPIGIKMPIDFFFKSLAEDQNELAIGIVLSGMGTDGTIGLKAIKNELGLVMAQDSDSAAYSSMPQSAINTGCVDYVVSPEKMPELLIKYIKHASDKTVANLDSSSNKIPDALQKVLIILRSITGHDFSGYKHNTIFRRIERRMNLHQIEHVSDYVRYLQQHRTETEILFKELLIGVTSFFRDPEAFDALKELLLSHFLTADKSNNTSFRIWVPACSTGEEAYSIAILIKECLQEIDRPVHVQIFATDLDANAIEIARLGKYPSGIAAHVKPERLKEFFSEHEESYIIQKKIRELIVFAPQNIIKDPPFTKIDLLCCRNLLIYLDSDLQKKLIPIFNYALNPEGMLFLGTSETIAFHERLFVLINKKWKLYKRREDNYAR